MLLWDASSPAARGRSSSAVWRSSRPPRSSVSASSGNWGTAGSRIRRASQREPALEQSTFGGHEADVVAVYSSATRTVDDPAFADAVRQTLASLPGGSVQRAVTWFDTQAPSLVSPDRRATRVIITLAGVGQTPSRGRGTRSGTTWRRRA